MLAHPPRTDPGGSAAARYTGILARFAGIVAADRQRFGHRRSQTNREQQTLFRLIPLKSEEVYLSGIEHYLKPATLPLAVSASDGLLPKAVYEFSEECHKASHGFTLLNESIQMSHACRWTAGMHHNRKGRFGSLNIRCKVCACHSSQHVIS